MGDGGQVMGMKIKRFTYGPFMTNTYVVSTDDAVLIIDPACFTQNEQLELEDYISHRVSDFSHQHSNISIIATHGHLDHLWGAAWATERYNVPVMIAEADYEMITYMQAQYDLFGINATAKAFPIAPLTACHWPLTIIPTPGHTQGSVCLYMPEEKILLSGDTLFRCGFGRTDLPGGNHLQLIESLKQLMTLPADTQVYPGHGETTTIGEENRIGEW